MATGDLGNSRTHPLMINHKDNALSFAFPKVGQEVHTHFEHQLRGSAVVELTRHLPQTIFPP